MKFRRAEISQKNEILALYRKASKSEFSTWNEFYPSIEDIENDLSSDSLFILESDDIIIGAISIVPENELDGLLLWKSNNAREFARVVISPLFQGRGLSKILISEIEKIVKSQGYEAIHILVAKKNIPAIRTYQKAGFSFLGEVEMYDSEFLTCEKILK